MDITMAVFLLNRNSLGNLTSCQDPNEDGCTVCQDTETSLAYITSKLTLIVVSCFSAKYTY